MPRPGTLSSGILPLFQTISRQCPSNFRLTLLCWNPVSESVRLRAMQRNATLLATHSGNTRHSTARPQLAIHHLNQRRGVVALAVGVSYLLSIVASGYTLVGGHARPQDRSSHDGLGIENVHRHVHARLSPFLCRSCAGQGQVGHGDALGSGKGAA